MSTNFFSLYEACCRVHDPQCVLWHDGQKAFDVQINERSLQFICEDETNVLFRMAIGPCGSISRKKDFYEEVLSANLFWNGLGGALLSIGSEEEGADAILWLSQRLMISDLLDDDVLQEYCWDMIRMASDWGKRIALYAAANNAVTEVQ